MGRGASPRERQGRSRLSFRSPSRGREIIVAFRVPGRHRQLPSSHVKPHFRASQRWAAVGTAEEHFHPLSSIADGARFGMTWSAPRSSEKGLCLMAKPKLRALSKTQVNKAGKILKDWWVDPGQGEVGIEFARAVDALIDYRASHQVPLTKATMGLRSRVRTAKCQNLEVSQRLKRIGTIMDKLCREPTMKLANMQDIGGCRAVLASIEEIRRVQKLLKPKTHRIYDYIEKPRESGYRGVHVIVQYDGRQTEVQLRTDLMHQWAYTVERLSGRLGQDLKGGRGPEPVLAWLRVVSEAMALEESGQAPDTEVMDRLRALRQEALPYLEGGSQ